MVLGTDYPVPVDQYASDMNLNALPTNIEFYIDEHAMHVYSQQIFAVDHCQCMVTLSSTCSTGYLLQLTHG
jgi:hypothetical protein